MTFPVVIHQNPDCGTTRNLLGIIRAAGHAPLVIEYLTTGWTCPQLLALFAVANIAPHQAQRVVRLPAEEIGLTAPEVTENQVLDAVIAHPILVNRPTVCTPKSICLNRRSEVVQDLLDHMPPGPFAKEDGQLIIDAEGIRLV